MHWYHFTGFGEFRSIIKDEALLSLIERLKKHFPERREKIDSIMDEHDEASLRRKYVFLTPEKSRGVDARGSDVRLCFELDRSPNYSGILILPSLSLEFLVEVGALRQYSHIVKQCLQIEHNGKYGKIPVRSME